MTASPARVLRGSFDLTVVGGGIVGLAAARQAALKHPKLRVCVVEKEKELASHQSKRNSGVVHCGIYYKKGSLKSRFCIRGSKLIKSYCHTKGLPFSQCGKLIVATRKQELEQLHKLHANAIANQIEGVELISKERVEEIQPGCSGALEAIWSPNTAIVDWQKVALSYAEDFEQTGGTIFTEFAVNDFSTEGEDRFPTIVLENAKQKGDYIESKSVVNCAGLRSDFIACKTANNQYPVVTPFKGKYYMLGDRLASTIKTNIYPVPNPKLPFLGVHITPRVDGSVLVGPTSLLTVGYELYTEEDPPKIAEIYQILFRKGVIKLISKSDNIKAGLLEFWRDISKNRFVKDVKALMPLVETSDLIDTQFCGIRAQAVTEDGRLMDDFLFESGILREYDRVLHVRNCPSPAATSSLAIAERIVDILEERYI